jgi:hypothetical protein
MLYQNKRIKFSNKLFCKTYVNKITKETCYPVLWRKDYVDFMRKKNGYIVYKITCKVTGLCYIGFTFLKVEQRWKGHCNAKPKWKFAKAIQEFGKENWTLEVLETFDTEFFAKAYEIYCIAKFDSIKNGYNMTEGGDGQSGCRRTAETILKLKKPKSEESKQKNRQSHLGKKNIRKNLTNVEFYGKERAKELTIKASESHKGIIPWNKDKTNIYTQETINKISNSLTGQTRSKESCEKQSKTSRGKKRKPFTQEHKDNIGKAKKGKKGQIPWNKGKKYSHKKRIISKEEHERRSNAQKGHIPWNKGKKTKKEKTK